MCADETTVTIRTRRGGTMPLYVVTPTERPVGAVIVLHEAFGLTPEMMEMTRRFARLGYLGVAPSLFHRTGGTVIPYEGASQIAAHAGILDLASILDDLDATLELLQTYSLRPAQVGVVGFCLGGSLAMIAAAHLAVGAVVSYYGPGITDSGRPYPRLLDVAPRLTSPWLGHYGDRDALIPLDEAMQLRSELNGPAPTRLHIYEGAGHAFAREGHASLHPTAARLAWDRTTEWLRTHLIRAD